MGGCSSRAKPQGRRTLKIACKNVCEPMLGGGGGGGQWGVYLCPWGVMVCLGVYQDRSFQPSSGSQGSWEPAELSSELFPIALLLIPRPRPPCPLTPRVTFPEHLVPLTSPAFPLQAPPSRPEHPLCGLPPCRLSFHSGATF